MTFARGRKDPQRARHLLDRVGLSHRLTHKPAALSVGEQQRVAVARALANRPSLLLADEPTANIDPRNQQKIVDLIRETCREEKRLAGHGHALDRKSPASSSASISWKKSTSVNDRMTPLTLTVMLA